MNPISCTRCHVNLTVDVTWTVCHGRDKRWNLALLCELCCDELLEREKNPVQIITCEPPSEVCRWKESSLESNKDISFRGVPFGHTRDGGLHDTAER